MCSCKPGSVRVPRMRFAVLAFLALAGCADEPAPNAAPMGAPGDAAVVESAAPRSELVPWTLSPTPRFVIGAASGDDANVLHRVYSARVLEDGRVLVSNSGLKQLQIHSSTGELLGAFGREGGGPGEFRDLSSMRILAVHADSIAVADERNDRIHFFDLRGNFGRTMRPAVVPGYGSPAIRARFASGEWLGFMPVGTGTLQGEPGDLIEMSLAFLTYTPDTRAAAPIGTVAGRTRVVNELGGGAIHYPFVPFSPDPVYTVAGDDLFYNASGEPEVQRSGSDGEPEATFRWASPRTPVREIRDRYTRALVSQVSEERRPAYERMMARSGMPVPDLVPAVASIAVDALGYIWVERYLLPWEDEPRWHVLDPDGAWLGDIILPPGLTVMDIGADYLLARQLDELDVERVVLYDLER